VPSVKPQVIYWSYLGPVCIVGDADVVLADEALHAANRQVGDERSLRRRECRPDARSRVQGGGSDAGGQRRSRRRRGSLFQNGAYRGLGLGAFHQQVEIVLKKLGPTSAESCSIRCAKRILSCS
jgi:hypothetical protein